MTDKQHEMTAYPRLLFWFFAVHTLLGLLWAVVCLGDLLLHPFAPDFMLQSVPGRLVVGLLIAPGTILIGGLVLRRENRNIVGVMLAYFGAAMYALTIRSDMTDPLALNILRYYALAAYLIPIELLPFYFPNGRAFPPRLSRWIDAFLVVGMILFYGLVFGNTNDNPLYFPPAAVIAEIATSTWGVHFPLLVALALYGMFTRYRQADIRQRLQMQWFAAIFLIFVCVSLLGMAITQIAGFIIPTTVSTLFYLTLFTFPVLAVGNAILRHRLYDIDIIIRRTLVYSVLTAILAVIYFGGIILTQQVFRTITGESSDLAIVLSTLAIAALFTPIRRRVQDIIDRRLYRRKYDVEKTLEAFNATLRDEVDIETLKTNLVGVVNETMQPSKIALWVKEENI